MAKREIKMLPKSAWPVTSRPIIPGPRPQLCQDQRDAIADMDTITAAPKGSRCVAIIGYGHRSTEEQWAVLRWSGSPPTAVTCGKKATVNIGCNFCTDHGGEHLAKRMRIQLRDAYQDWDFETRERVVGHPLATRWEDWERHGLRVFDLDENDEPIGDGYLIERRTYGRKGIHSPFSTDLLELGVRACEPLWHLFEDECDDEVAA